MASRKINIKNSLQVKLSLWLSLSILIVALAGASVAFYTVFEEATDLQDNVLHQIVQLVDQYHLTAVSDYDSSREAYNDEESQIFVQILSPRPQISTQDTNTLALPATLPDGIQTLNIDNKDFRVLIKTFNSGERLAVAQATEARDETAEDSALNILISFLVLVPILLLLVTYLVRTIFKTLVETSHHIDQRGEQNLDPISSDRLPSEIQPFVGAINRLLKRVEESMEAQRRFVANAAHELRSPLTALSLQAERLSGSEMSSLARERLATLQQGIERGRSLLDQLLALARAQSPISLPSTKVSVLQVYRRVLEDLMPLAEAKGIDIGVMSEEDAHVLVSEVDLISLVKNLAHNAILYTPPNGHVDLFVSTFNELVVLSIEDNGPGIPEAEQERVFDSFYRVLGNNEIGSGLGLSIVESIAIRVNAKISLAFSNESLKTGLRVTLTFL
jgi:two-component system, OmpR family, sensor kinase